MDDIHTAPASALYAETANVVDAAIEKLQAMRGEPLRAVILLTMTPEGGTGQLIAGLPNDVQLMLWVTMHDVKKAYEEAED